MKVRNDRKIYCTQYGVVIDVSHAPMFKFLFKVFRTLVILMACDSYHAFAKRFYEKKKDKK